MAHIAFIVSVPRYRQGALGSYVQIGEQLAQLVAKDVPLADGVRFISMTKSDHILQAVTTDSVVNPTAANLHASVVVAGGAAGDVTVAGVLSTSVLLSVVGVKDSDQTNHDFTSEFTAAAGKINNTGGTSSSGYHLVVTWYEPPAAINAPVS